MELDDDAKEAAREIGEAINDAVAESEAVKDAVQNLRDLGYEAHYTLNLKIAVEKIDDFDEPNDAENFELELTDEDLRTLQRMKIRFE